MESAFERFLRPVEGTASQAKFLKRVQAVGFTPKADPAKYKDPIADFDPRTGIFEYNPSTFSAFNLFHERQHLVVYERAKALRFSFGNLFGGKTGAILEADAYLAEQWLCERYGFPEDFTCERRDILEEYIHKARTALRNRESLRQFARQILGYDIQRSIERYFS